jgi:hypothetical protein
MIELLDNNPTQQETIKGELELAFIQVAKINDQINNIEARLTDSPPPAEMAMLGRMAIGLEQQKNDLISWFSFLTIKSLQPAEVPIVADTQTEIAIDDKAFNNNVARVIANLTPIISAEDVPEIIDQTPKESPPIEISPTTETIQSIEVKTSKPIVSKSKKAGSKASTKQAKQPSSAVTTKPKVSSKHKMPPKTHPKTLKPNQRSTDWQEMMEVRRRYLESLEKESSEPIVLTDRQKLNRNIDQRLLKFLIGQGEKPKQPVSERTRIATFNAFWSTPTDKRKPGWQKRMIEAQIA